MPTDPEEQAVRWALLTLAAEAEAVARRALVVSYRLRRMGEDEAIAQMEEALRMSQQEVMELQAACCRAASFIEDS